MGRRANQGSHQGHCDARHDEAVDSARSHQRHLFQRPVAIPIPQGFDEGRTVFLRHRKLQLRSHDAPGWAFSLCGGRWRASPRTAIQRQSAVDGAVAAERKEPARKSRRANVESRGAGQNVQRLPRQTRRRGLATL